MKFFLLFIGTVCLFGGIHAQISTVATSLTAAFTTANTNLTQTITRVNNTIVAADRTILKAWNQLGQSLVSLYNSYLTRFQPYTTLDLSPITSAISNVQSMMANQPQRMQDDTWTTQQIFTDAQSSVQQIQNAMIAAIANMTSACGSNCLALKTINCAKKYAILLLSDPFSVDRVTQCVAAEEARFANIAANITTLYGNSLTMAMNYLAVGNVCDIPPASVLNNATTSSMPPSTQCLTNYLQRFSSIPSFGYYSADSSRMSQTQLIAFRSKRCSKLVALDIKDRISQIVDKFNSCLVTGL